MNSSNNCGHNLYRHALIGVTYHDVECAPRSSSYFMKGVSPRGRSIDGVSLSNLAHEQVCCNVVIEAASRIVRGNYSALIVQLMADNPIEVTVES